MENLRSNLCIHYELTECVIEKSHYFTELKDAGMLLFSTEA
jgi:hypothetical protein